MRAARILCLCLLVAACGPSLTPAATLSPPDSPSSVASAPRIAQPPVSPPAPPGTNLPAFACADVTGGRTGVAGAVTARLAEQIVYDRFVLQFDSPVPSYTVRRQATPTFPSGASGQTITLSGTAGVLVNVQTASGANTFTGPTDLTHGEFLVVKEARQTQDFEGHLSWGIGLGKPACMRVFTLTDPARLVVDFSTT